MQNLFLASWYAALLLGAFAVFRLARNPSLYAIPLIVTVIFTVFRFAVQLWLYNAHDSAFWTFYMEILPWAALMNCACGIGIFWALARHFQNFLRIGTLVVVFLALISAVATMPVCGLLPMPHDAPKWARGALYLFANGMAGVGLLVLISRFLITRLRWMEAMSPWAIAAADAYALYALISSTSSLLSILLGNGYSYWGSIIPLLNFSWFSVAVSLLPAWDLQNELEEVPALGARIRGPLPSFSKLTEPVRRLRRDYERELRNTLR